MMTPVTLARIDLRLRNVFNGEYPFGGKDVILIGDMWQFVRQSSFISSCSQSSMSTTTYTK